MWSTWSVCISASRSSTSGEPSAASRPSGRPSLAPHAGRPGGAVAVAEARRAPRSRARRPASWSSSRSGQQRLGEAGEVPLRDHRLVAVGVAAAGVDRAVDGGRVEGVHERARPVVDGLAGDRHVVGVHHAVDEADQHPLRDQRRLGGDDRLEEREVRVLGVGGLGVVPGDRVVGEPAQQVGVAGGAGVLEAADPQVAARDPGQHGARAARSRAAPGGRSPTTASERVVGMPRACMASLTTYSRSIGPTAARPSPPRANGVRPEPFRCRSRSRRRPSMSSPSSSARPSPSRGE